MKHGRNYSYVSDPTLILVAETHWDITAINVQYTLEELELGHETAVDAVKLANGRYGGSIRAFHDLHCLVSPRSISIT